jgi:type IV pilus assembly protein PilA
LIIVAIVLVIAVAVGWYLYTTFVASTTAQGRLAISNAEFYTGDKKLRLFVMNPGPQEVTIQSVVLQGTTCNVDSPIPVSVGSSMPITVECNDAPNATPGTMLPGYVTTTVGATFPFNAIAKSGNAP